MFNVILIVEINCYTRESEFGEAIELSSVFKISKHSFNFHFAKILHPLHLLSNLDID